MSKKIHIEISGCAGVGKSSVMHKIIEVLRDEGFKVELVSPLTMLDYGSESKFEMKMRENRDKSLEAIKKKSKIIIGERQLARNIQLPRG